MMKHVFGRSLPLMAALMMLVGGHAVAQEWTQSTACPGWNNPTNFVTGSTTTYYQGNMGTKGSAVPNAQSGYTGVTWDASVIAASAMETTVNSDVGGDQALFPSNKHTDRPFEIYNATDYYDAAQVNMDPNTNYQLPYVPTYFNTYDSTLEVQTNLSKSIRVGTGRGRSAGGHNAAALYYNMRVTPNNALMCLYYACVFEGPGHGTNYDPAFMIRVMTQNSAGQWVQASPTNANPPASGSNQCDTLAYFVTGTPATMTGGTLVNGQNGWHQYGSSYSGVWYKDWEKVMLDLSPLMYCNVRIEVMVAGCGMTQHWSYGYICGECRPMQIASSGYNPATIGNQVTLAAPRGMLNYVWYASEYGRATASNSFLLPDSDPSSTAYYTFRQLTPSVGTDADTAYLYHVQESDFAVTYRPNSAHVQGIPASVDSVADQQTFRCTVTSAIDPNKPYQSNLYFLANRLKYAVAYDTVCDTVYYWHDDTLTSSGTYTYSNPYTEPWDSIYVLNLTLNSPSIIHDTVETACRYFWNGEMLTTSGFYVDTLTAANGCDSIMMLDLNIVYPCDTVYIHDTIYVEVTDTLYVHDTLYIHDTVYVGVDDVEAIDVKIFVNGGQIVVEGAENNAVTLYDAVGRQLATRRDGYGTVRFDVSATGTYLVKIGDKVARKVVVAGR